MENQESLKTVKEQILNALSHPEAEEGLYLSNLLLVHDEDTRPNVEASENEILHALEELISEGAIVLDEFSGKVVFRKTA